MHTVIPFLVLAVSATAPAPTAPPTVACTMETHDGDAHKLLYTTDYLVDARGLLASEEVRDAKGPITRVSYTRDAGGRVAKKCTFDLRSGTEAPDGCAVLRYKGNGRRPITNEEIAEDGTVAATTTFKYDARGLEISRRLVRADGSTVTQTRTYDARGRLDTVRLVDPKWGSTLFRSEYADTGALARVVIESLDPRNRGAVVGTRDYVKPCAPALLVDAS